MSLDARMMSSREVCKWGSDASQAAQRFRGDHWDREGSYQRMVAEIAHTLTAHKTAREILKRNGYIKSL